MKKHLRSLLALVLVLSLLLSGCSASSFETFFQGLAGFLQGSLTVPFDDMTYTRPDPNSFVRAAGETSQNAQTAENADALMEEIYRCYDLYYDFYTNYTLSLIHYSTDITDIYWEKEYNYCQNQSAQVDGAMDALLYALADSPLRSELEKTEYFGEGYFSAYDGESFWDDTFTGLMARESELLNKYYELTGESLEETGYTDEYFSTWGARFSELFCQLVVLRQEIAAYAGYESYVAFAYDYYYHRDYTPQQAAKLMEGIQKELTELYVSIPDGVWAAGFDSCTEKQSLAYVESFAKKMGGTIWDAFLLMKENNLYDNRISANKSNTSFEVFLDTYFVPYIFLDPSGYSYDKLTFAHEFGHFCNDYAACGTAVNVDVAEIFSQSMEYLSLRYSDDAGALEKRSMAESLSTFVEQAAYASFEHQLYMLPKEQVTPENVRALYESVGKAYGFDREPGWDTRDYVRVPHFYVHPMYIISYVVSNDAAMQIYQAELETQGAGLTLLTENLATEQPCFLAFTKEAGLDNPFAEGRAASLRKTFEAILFDKP